MAEKHLVYGQDGGGFVAVADNQDEGNSEKQMSKRCASSIPSTAPPNKSPRTNSQSPTTHTPHAEEEQSETDAKRQAENTEGPSRTSGSPSGRRKSWRRATITRRSLPALPNPYQVLCRSISTSLSQHERLEKLMDSSVKVAIERTQNSLHSVPNASLESFQTQVKRMQREWSCLGKSIHSEPQGRQFSINAASNLVWQTAMEKVHKAMNRLQTESESWEALLNKHRSKAEELERKVEQCQHTGMTLDSTSLAQSSQCLFIQSKPDYQKLLRRQQPMLHTVEMIMDTQCKMIRELLSIREQSQLLVKETSGRLAAEAGFQDLSPDLIRNFMRAPLSSATKYS
ncbi:Kinetochore-associated protein DSN1 -like protein [Channa argus]|uniref:Kinetochore-associated protein DSN1-like protein n=1 Tax=Channa argus TaxID=215402 RepID=A0A6G1QCQ4_CHAAH|nr:Kinetochore-associated protein DSN1 -like protein [Channa argus]KAK2893711.1 hypothetical protein Q8A73_016195 [Channa argus]